ncbi:unnamed protein product [Cuscuta campestris]|uniref:Ty3 transposon capsid-like protein domain-containing protein n=1 Tax=Cuscuta campestris TaxID=132261 RepID=A0A484MIH2_9ASTE|nr:unnamed protein product [Cuscuta campestris]
MSADPNKQPETPLPLSTIMQAIQNLGLELNNTNKRLDALARKFEADPTDPGRTKNPPPERRWQPPPSRTTGRADPADRQLRLRIDPPRFSGEDSVGWIFRIQQYFDYFATSEVERMQLVGMFIDHPASEWYRYYTTNSCGGSWVEFLQAVKQRFDPDHYFDYVSLLSKLQQQTTVLAYQTAFEGLLNKVSGIPEATLISMYKGGLKQPLQREVNLRNPGMLVETFSLARELAACTSFLGTPRRGWQPSAGSTAAQPVATAAEVTPSKPSSLPIVCLSPAERAERSWKGLCWNCEEKYVPGHRCAHKFLVLLGTDDEELTDDLDADAPPVMTDTALITGDVSSILNMSELPNPRSLRLAGSINGSAVQVLIDGGSTHNFIHPAHAERLSLILHPVTPFRVYVGNGDSLRCSYFCPKSPLILQGHSFEVDLFMLPVHGPDVVLGVQWLQGLGKVSHDYANMTMEFQRDNTVVVLKGDVTPPKSLSFSAF